MQSDSLVTQSALWIVTFVFVWLHSTCTFEKFHSNYWSMPENVEFSWILDLRHLSSIHYEITFPRKKKLKNVNVSGVVVFNIGLYQWSHHLFPWFSFLFLFFFFFVPLSFCENRMMNRRTDQINFPFFTSTFCSSPHQVVSIILLSNWKYFFLPHFSIFRSFFFSLTHSGQLILMKNTSATTWKFDYNYQKRVSVIKLNLNWIDCKIKLP